MRKYTSYTEARAHLKDVLDEAEEGRSALIQRDAKTSTVVLDAARLRDYLAAVVPQRAVVLPEVGAWSVFIPGLPLAAEAGTFPEAITEMVDVLREYAEDWTSRLHGSTNHSKNWGLVQFIALCDDAQLEAWLTGSSA